MVRNRWWRVLKECQGNGPFYQCDERALESLSRRLNSLVYFGISLGFPGGSDGKASARNAGDPGSVLGREDPLEKEMAIHSSTLAWKIPWMEEPDRLQSMGLQSRT